jgi:hypothetical protein
VTQEFDPASGTWHEVGRGAAFALPAGPAVVMTPGDTRAQQLYAERAVKEVPAELRDVRTEQGNIRAMPTLLDQGAEPGKWPDAVKRWAQDRFGIDLGQDPKLASFTALGQSQALTIAQQLKGTFSDRDISFVQMQSASPARGPETNRLVLATGNALLERKAKELQAEQDYYSKNGNLAGFDAWLQHESAGWGPVFSDQLINGVASAHAAAAQEHADTVAGLAKALEAGDATAAGKIVSQDERGGAQGAADARSGAA